MLFKILWQLLNVYMMSVVIIMWWSKSMKCRIDQNKIRIIIQGSVINIWYITDPRGIEWLTILVLNIIVIYVDISYGCYKRNYCWRIKKVLNAVSLDFLNEMRCSRKDESILMKMGYSQCNIDRCSMLGQKRIKFSS